MRRVVALPEVVRVLCWNFGHEEGNFPEREGPQGHLFGSLE